MDNLSRALLAEARYYLSHPDENPERTRRVVEKMEKVEIRDLPDDVLDLLIAYLEGETKSEGEEL